MYELLIIMYTIHAYDWKYWGMVFIWPFKNSKSDIDVEM